MYVSMYCRQEIYQTSKDRRYNIENVAIKRFGDQKDAVIDPIELLLWG